MYVLIEEDEWRGIKLYGPFVTSQDAWEARERIAEPGLVYGVVKLRSAEKGV